MLEKVKKLIIKMNDYGIPLPLCRAAGEPSVTLTLVFISTTVVLVGFIGRFASFLGGIDLSQALYWNLMCMGAYLGRRISSEKGGLDGVNQKDV